MRNTTFPSGKGLHCAVTGIQTTSPYRGKPRQHFWEERGIVSLSHRDSLNLSLPAGRGWAEGPCFPGFCTLRAPLLALFSEHILPQLPWRRPSGAGQVSKLVISGVGKHLRWRASRGAPPSAIPRERGQWSPFPPRPHRGWRPFLCQ